MERCTKPTKDEETNFHDRQVHCTSLVSTLDSSIEQNSLVFHVENHREDLGHGIKQKNLRLETKLKFSSKLVENLIT
jgi:hypothetical protein